MPLMRCEVDGKKGWKYGESGKCYTGDNARELAARQGRAIEASKARRSGGKGIIGRAQDRQK